MKRFIIDDENIGVDNIFKIIDPKKKDRVYIVTNARKKISMQTLKLLNSKKVKFKIFMISDADRDFADKIIVFLMGKFFDKKGKICVVSNDKFYDSVMGFFNALRAEKKEKFKKITLQKEGILKIDESKNKEIESILLKSSNLQELHIMLKNAYGEDEGLVIYKTFKQKARQIYTSKMLASPKTKALIKEPKNSSNLSDKTKQDKLSLIKNADANNLLSKNSQEIKNIARESKNTSEFHNALIKKYGSGDGVTIYTILKDRAKAYFQKRGNPR